MKTIDSHRSKFAEQLIAKLEQGEIFCHKPWVSAERPYNPTTNNQYKGINTMFLVTSSEERGYIDPRWCTFLQAKQEGWKVRPGETGTKIEFWRWETNEKKLREGEQPIGSGEEHTPTKLSKPIYKLYTVFNASQLEGIPPYEKRVQEWSTVELAERILAGSGAVIEHKPYQPGATRAVYSPIEDKIILPPRENFNSAEKYYAIALHELAHWTGHEKRLNRDLTNISSETGVLAKEELRAEIASYFINNELGLSQDFENTAAYLQSWISTLKEDKLEIFRAINEADKICSYIMDFAKEKEVVLNVQAKMPQKTFEEFASELGLIISGQGIADGKIHRVAVEGGKPKSKIIICEGFSTGGSIYEATKLPVVAAMDTHNLKNVALAFREKYGDKLEIIIAGDNDHSSKGSVKNPGEYHALDAAKAVGGKAIIPRFTKEEMEQGLTDFNDLAASKGKLAVKQQINKVKEEKSQAKCNEIAL